MHLQVEVDGNVLGSCLIGPRILGDFGWRASYGTLSIWITPPEGFVSSPATNVKTLEAMRMCFKRVKLRASDVAPLLRISVLIHAHLPYLKLVETP